MSHYQDPDPLHGRGKAEPKLKQPTSATRRQGYRYYRERVGKCCINGHGGVPEWMAEATRSPSIFKRILGLASAPVDQPEVADLRRAELQAEIEKESGR